MHVHVLYRLCMCICTHVYMLKTRVEFPDERAQCRSPAGQIQCSMLVPCADSLV